jgi:hypothetical protein
MSNETPIAQLPKVQRSTAGLRDALFDALDDLRGPKPDVSRSMAVAAISREIINVAKAEMDFHQRLNKDKQLSEDFTTRTLELGSERPEQGAKIDGVG